MNNITHILTIFKPTIYQINYWKEIYIKIIEKGDQFIVASDNPDIEFDLNKLFPLADVLFAKRNRGKLKTVLESKKIWKHEFIKTLDPDDYISITDLNKTRPNLIKGCINRMYSKRIYKEIQAANESKVEKIYSCRTKKYFKSLGTSWTILPSCGFDDENLFPESDIYINEDQLLGQICLSSGAKIVDIDAGFYLYHVENGVSNSNKLNIYYKKVLNTINEYKVLKSKIEYKNPVSWPSKRYYRHLFVKSLIKKNNTFFDNFRLLKTINDFIDSDSFIRTEDSIEQKNVVFISDENQVKYSLTNISHIFNQNYSNDIKIFLILDKVNEAKYAKTLSSFDPEAKKRLKIINIDFDKKMFNSKIKHITNSTFIRLFLHEILEEDVRRVLYLDNDTIVEGNLSKAFDMFEINEFYGRRWNKSDPWPKILKALLLMDRRCEYVNAGVLHLSLEKLRRENFTQKLYDFQRKKKKFLKYGDQDILNCLIRFKRMPYFLNISAKKWEEDYKYILSDDELKIFHFLSINKQWSDEFEPDKQSSNLLQLSDMRKIKNEWIEMFNSLK